MSAAPRRSPRFSTPVEGIKYVPPQHRIAKKKKDDDYDVEYVKLENESMGHEIKLLHQEREQFFKKIARLKEDKKMLQDMLGETIRQLDDIYRARADAALVTASEIERGNHQ